MRSKRLIVQRLFAGLIRLYPRAWRERHGEGMAQTFADLCHERTRAGRGVTAAVVMAVADTLLGIAREHLSAFSSYTMESKHVLRPLLLTGILLLIPAVGERTVEDWQWSMFDFVIAAVVVFAFAFAFEMLARRSSNMWYRAGAGITVLSLFLMLWVNAAVGIIGEDNGIGLCYLVVAGIGCIGAILSRLEASGLSRTLLGMAAIVVAIPFGVLFLTPHFLFEPPGMLRIFIGHLVLAGMFIAAAVLFRNAAMAKRA